MCFKDLRRNLTSSAEKREKAARSPSSTRTSTDSSSHSSSSSYSSSRASIPTSPTERITSPTNVSDQVRQRQATPVPPQTDRRLSSRTQSSDQMDGVFLKRDSAGRNWFHGPGGLVKQQIGWKMPINRIDPEINQNTSHGRRSRLANVSEERSLSRIDHTSSGSAELHQNRTSTRAPRPQVRRVSTIGSIADVTGLDSMSIDSITSVEAAVGRAVSLTDSDDSETESKTRTDTKALRTKALHTGPTK